MSDAVTAVEPRGGDRGTASLAQSLARDDTAWDDLVANSAQPCYLQTTPWAAIKRVNGWMSRRVITTTANGPVAAQMLVRRPRGAPWSLGYIPRGPVSPRPLDAAALTAFDHQLRAVARAKRIVVVRMEPEAESGRGLEDTLRSLGWRPVHSIQQVTTRIIDIARPQEQIWADLHRKTRQSITKSERLGVRVVVGDGSRLGDFYRIHLDSMTRQGIAARSERTFHEMWRHLEPRGMAHLFFAEIAATSEPVATLFLISSGPRVADLYGGTTHEGNQRRANHLLKWEAIRLSQDRGYREYDLWGLPRDGIAQFKSGFGGREVDYVGGWELTVGRLGPRIMSAAEGLWDRYRRLRGVRRPERSYEDGTIGQR